MATAGTNIDILCALFSLSVFAFLAATIIPVSSEGALVAALSLDSSTIPALVFAIIENCAGIAFNYWLGWKGEEKLLHKYLQKRSSLGLSRDPQVGKVVFIAFLVVGHR
ncbi:MAG: hypothetical protein ACE5G1_07845 [bacterium]